MGGYIGATAVGLTTTAADVQGDITSTDTTPELILKNTTETDADGGRDGKITFKGEQSGGEESTLAQIQSSHDGTADDQAADLIFKTNDGSDNNTPTERLRIDKNGSILTATLGTDNVHLGEGAGASIASGGNENVAIGKDALTANTTGDANTAVGFSALTANTTGVRNTAVGRRALVANTTGNDNDAFGRHALEANTTGSQNVAIGRAALASNTTANGNTAVGYSSLIVNTTGHSNVAIGEDALANNTTGYQNTAVGYETLNANTSNEATAFGYRAGASNTSGANFTAIGWKSMESNTSGHHNTAVGIVSLKDNTTGLSNTAMGVAALRYNTTGNYNSAFGHNALFNNTTAAENTAVGYGALQSNTTGASNAAFGKDALFDATTGDHNSGLGQNALANVTTGSYNVGTARGGEAITTGDGNVCVGYQANTPASSTQYSIVMGFQSTGVGSENFTFGKGSTDSNIAFGATSITAPSDERYKEEITTSTAGLSFINDLRPVTFKWKKAKDVPSDHDAYIADGEEGCDDRVMLSNGETNHGFIAQEVKTVIDNHPEIKDGFGMWSEDYREDADGNQITNNRQRLAPSELIPILTKAIQELSAKNDALETRIAALEGA